MLTFTCQTQIDLRNHKQHGLHSVKDMWEKHQTSVARYKQSTGDVADRNYNFPARVKVTAHDVPHMPFAQRLRVQDPKDDISVELLHLMPAKMKFPASRREGQAAEHQVRRNGNKKRAEWETEMLPVIRDRFTGYWLLPHTASPSPIAAMLDVPDSSYHRHPFFPSSYFVLTELMRLASEFRHLGPSPSFIEEMKKTLALNPDDNDRDMQTLLTANLKYQLQQKEGKGGKEGKEKTANMKAAMDTALHTEKETDMDMETETGASAADTHDPNQRKQEEETARKNRDLLQAMERELTPEQQETLTNALEKKRTERIIMAHEAHQERIYQRYTTTARTLSAVWFHKEFASMYTFRQAFWQLPIGADAQDPAVLRQAVPVPLEQKLTDPMTQHLLRDSALRTILCEYTWRHILLAEACAVALQGWHWGPWPDVLSGRNEDPLAKVKDAYRGFYAARPNPEEAFNVHKYPAILTHQLGFLSTLFALSRSIYAKSEERRASAAESKEGEEDAMEVEMTGQTEAQEARPEDAAIAGLEIPLHDPPQALRHLMEKNQFQTTDFSALSTETRDELEMLVILYMLQVLVHPLRIEESKHAEYSKNKMLGATVAKGGTQNLPFPMGVERSAAAEGERADTDGDGAMEM